MRVSKSITTWRKLHKFGFIQVCDQYSYLPAYLHTYIHTCTHTHIPTYIYIYIHTYTLHTFIIIISCSSSSSSSSSSSNSSSSLFVSFFLSMQSFVTLFDILIFKHTKKHFPNICLIII